MKKLSLRRWITWLTCGYVVLWLIWRASLFTTLREQYWQIQLTTALAAWFYLPALIFVAAALLVRSRLGLAFLVVPLLLFALDYGGQFVPNTRSVHAGSPDLGELRVVTWNGHLSDDRAGELRGMLRDLQPDVVALQEVSFALSKTLDADMADLYPYQVFVLPGASSSLGLLSRHPVMEEDAWTDWTSCQCLRVVLDWNDQPVTVINTHVWGPMIQLQWMGVVPAVHGFQEGHQRVTFEELLRMAKAESNPLILAGDFNTTEQQSNYLMVTQVLEDAFVHGGWGFGFTYPDPSEPSGVGLPVIRIDHVFYDHNWRTVRAWTDRIAGSDHLSVGAELRLTDSGETNEAGQASINMDN